MRASELFYSGDAVLLCIRCVLCFLI